MENPQNPIKKCLGYKRTLEFYSDLISFHKFQFKYNVPLNYVERVRKEFESSGLEVFVGSIAFNLSGEVDAGLRAMLVREKRA